MKRILTAAAVASLVLSLVVVSGVARAAAVKTASVSLSFDTSCNAVSTATWSGYRVDHVRHIFHQIDATGTEHSYIWTTSFPMASTSGTAVAALTPITAHSTDIWYVEALFRSTGGAILARATSATETPDASRCP